MKKRSIWIFALIAVLVLADQILKIWVKTHMHLGESVTVFPDWFQLYFIENNGAAFGMQLNLGGGYDWGKLLLSIFRIGMVGVLVWYLVYIIRQRAPMGVLVGLAMIIAGALGNIIDSAFYGIMFSASTPLEVAHFGDGYAPLLMGRVVDMFYFPLFHWGSCPDWLGFLVDSRGYFFGPVFNLADAYISVAVVYLLVAQFRYFK